MTSPSATFTSRPSTSPLRRLFAGLGLLLACACLNPAQAADDDFEDPKSRIRLLYKKFRADLAADSRLKRCEDAALEDYLAGHLGEFLDIPQLIHDIAFKQTSEHYEDMPEDRQKMLDAAFAKFIVHDNFSALKQACTARNLRIRSSHVDFTVSRVDSTLLSRPRKAQPVNFMLSRGWDHWTVSDVFIGDRSLADKYRASLGPAIVVGGYEGLLNRLINLNM